ncbi:hypothetical protein L7F22_003123 [Adiantum nelumboides]|nr:hypothetical protein [Adiantum nelumboides]
MTISLTAVAASTTPTVIKTFFKHYKTQWTKEKEDRWTEATDELMFDEAFHIVKQFINIATTDTVESLQRFTNTHVPAQPGTTSLRLLIPIDSCDESAKLLIKYFGDDDLRHLVGGRLWWQVRGLRGVQAEWIAMKQDWNRATLVEKRMGTKESEKELRKKAKQARLNKRHERKHSFAKPIRKSLDKRRSNKSVPKLEKEDKVNDEGKGKEKEQKDDNPDTLDEGVNEPMESFEELDRLKRVMYYIHGGGYYFGSLSTHRLMITRFARKFGGRAFAVNYRKAPQYPWPCAVQDVLAGYLYLIRPPPEARHKAIDPSQIVVAGDSAGGGLCLALLGILRDLDLPMPAGGVLLSPWCDMTHSFPSILQNTATDIIPTYGFIHKPSTLWPLPDDPLPAGAEDADRQSTHHSQSGNATPKKRNNKDKLQGNEVASLAEYANDSPGDHEKSAPPSLSHLKQKEFSVMIQNKKGEEVPLKVTRQIQLYATNAQLFHPLCSPILQGSLGGLPPLYILAGDSEVLRDEIIYLAHRAAHPDAYPLRKDLLNANKRAQESAERFNHRPTKVHLQVYDGQPHVLTLFSFTTSARYAYRAIASFVKHVTGAPTNVINPFPNLAEAPSERSEVPSVPPVHETTVGEPESIDPQYEKKKLEKLDTNLNSTKQNGDAIADSPVPVSGSSSHTNAATGSESNGNQVTPLSSITPTKSKDESEKMIAIDAPTDKHTLRERRRRNVTLGAENAYDGQVPLRRPTFVQEMIRERVDIRGKIRPLEEAELLQALRMQQEEIGVVKEGAVSRYLTGQTKWDDKFKKEAKRVAKRRAKNEERVKIMLDQAAKEGLLEELPKDAPVEHLEVAEGDEQADGWADLVRLGPLALAGETPPPSAIAGRRDTGESVELLRQALHMRADRFKASIDAKAKASLGSTNVGPRERSRVHYRTHTGGHWKQSAAERQVEGKAKYGLKAWAGAMSFFGRKKQEDAKRKRASLVQKGKHVNSIEVEEADNESWVDSNPAEEGASGATTSANTQSA